jgi:hypothetical protein
LWDEGKWGSDTSWVSYSPQACSARRLWLVERTRLFAAVNTLDGDKKRGLLLIE